MISSRYKRFSSINITNLVDVTIVLLVIFMLSAPVIQRSADISPPSTDQGRVITSLDPGTSLVVEIDELGNLTVAGTPVLMEELSDISEAAITSGHKEVFLRADKDVRYEIVALALTELRRGGYPNVGLIQEQRNTQENE